MLTNQYATDSFFVRLFIERNLVQSHAFILKNVQRTEKLTEHQVTNMNNITFLSKKQVVLHCTHFQKIYIIS